METPQDVMNWVGNAISDMAYDQVKIWEESGFDDTEGKLLEEAKANGVCDISGWYADHEYDNADTLGDLMGDRVCDICGFDTPERTEFVKELRELRSDSSWQEACNRIDR